MDDTPANLQVLAGMLKDRGYKVRPVPGGRLALLAARRDKNAVTELELDEAIDRASLGMERK